MNPNTTNDERAVQLLADARRTMTLSDYRQFLVALSAHINLELGDLRRREEGNYIRRNNHYVKL